jgi:hypothetical protein
MLRLIAKTTIRQLRPGSISGKHWTGPRTSFGQSKQSFFEKKDQKTF